MSNSLNPDHAGPDLGPNFLLCKNYQQTTLGDEKLRNLCILKTPKRVLWQTVKTQMKCGISSESALFAMIKMIFRD